MMKKHSNKIWMFILLATAVSACGKEFLEEKFTSNQVIPASLDDVSAILNGIEYHIRPSRELGIIGADEYYVLPSTHGRANAYMKNGYIWADEVYEGFDIHDWVQAYQRILYANLALDVLDKIEDSSPAYLDLRGIALFHRANNYYQLAQLFCRPYGQVENDPLGLPLSLEVDVSSRVGRSTLQETYAQIIADLQAAADLIATDFTGTTAVSKAAVYAVLSRVYMHMGDFPKVLHYSDLCLSIKSTLVDFNTLDPSRRYTFLQDYGVSNPEVIWFEGLPGVQLIGGFLNVDSTLYFSYGEHDLRFPLFFHQENDGRITFKGTYTGINSFFVGVAVDEIYLNKAEAHVRLGQFEQARESIGTLLAHRYAAGNLPSYQDMEHVHLLEFVLQERRKELLFRGLRWEDLRRLNLDPSTATALERRLGETIFVLAPGHAKYTWPIPDKEVDYGKVVQNPR